MLNETTIQAVGTGYKDEGDLRVEECNGRKIDKRAIGFYRGYIR